MPKKKIVVEHVHRKMLSCPNARELYEKRLGRSLWASPGRLLLDARDLLHLLNELFASVDQIRLLLLSADSETNSGRATVGFLARFLQIEFFEYSLHLSFELFSQSLLAFSEGLTDGR